MGAREKSKICEVCQHDGVIFCKRSAVAVPLILHQPYREKRPNTHQNTCFHAFLIKTNKMENSCEKKTRKSAIPLSFSLPNFFFLFFLLLHSFPDMSDSSSSDGEGYSDNTKRIKKLTKKATSGKRLLFFLWNFIQDALFLRV